MELTDEQWNRVLDAVRSESADDPLLQVEQPWSWIVDHADYLRVYVCAQDPDEVTAGDAYETWIIDVKDDSASVARRFRTRRTRDGDVTIPD